MRAPAYCNDVVIIRLSVPWWSVDRESGGAKMLTGECVHVFIHFFVRLK